MKIFALGGLTESGKGTVGSYLATKGIRKLKIGELLKPIYQKSSSQKDFQQWNFEAEAERPDWLMEAFWNELAGYMSRHEVEFASIDSLYGPVMGRYLVEKAGGDGIILYIAAPYETRLHRQMMTGNVSTLAEAKALLDEKDAFKVAKGTLEVKTIAHECVDNSGTLDDLYLRLDQILQRHNIALSQTNRRFLRSR